MTADQIAELRKLDRAPDGSCWYCGTVMRGHFDGCPVSLVPRLLDEREALLGALKEAMVKLGDARSALSHCWASECPPAHGDWVAAEEATDAAQKAIAKAEAP